jgi:hypothetical protein
MGRLGPGSGEGLNIVGPFSCLGAETGVQFEAPHNMFYGMREVIVRDLNGFWITFGQEVSGEVLTPWQPVDSELLRLYKGRYHVGDMLKGTRW